MAKSTWIEGLPSEDEHRLGQWVASRPVGREHGCSHVCHDDIIIGTDWMRQYDPHISFKNRTITVDGQTVVMENIREDLIRECSLIEAREVETLFKG